MITKERWEFLKNESKYDGCLQELIAEIEHQVKQITYYIEQQEALEAKVTMQYESMCQKDIKIEELEKFKENFND